MNEERTGYLALYDAKGDWPSLELPWSANLQREGVRAFSSSSSFFGNPGYTRDRMCLAVFLMSWRSSFIVNNPWHRQDGELDVIVRGPGWTWGPVHTQTRGSKEMDLPGISICGNQVVDSGNCMSGGVSPQQQASQETPPLGWHASIAR